MIFSHTWEKVLNGTKTQTRRLAKTNEVLVQREDARGGYKPLYVRSNTHYRKLWEVGKTYAVQRGRGVAAESQRIIITGIRKQDVRSISAADAIAEGFATPYEFLRLWCSMHDPYVLIDHRIIPGEWTDRMPRRPSGKYQAWVLSFHLVK